MRHWTASAAILTVAIILAATPVVVRGQTNGHKPHRVVHVYANGGVAAPISVFDDRFKTGVGGGFALGFAPRSISNGEIEFLLRGQIEKFSPQESGRPKITFLSGGFDIKYNLSPYGPTNVFLIMGGGLTQTQWSEGAYRGQTIASQDQMDLHGEAGVGVEYLGESLAPFLQLRLKNVTGKAMGNYYFFKFEMGLKL